MFWHQSVKKRVSKRLSFFPPCFKLCFFFTSITKGGASRNQICPWWGAMRMQWEPMPLPKNSHQTQTPVATFLILIIRKVPFWDCWITASQGAGTFKTKSKLQQSPAHGTAERSRSWIFQERLCQRLPAQETDFSFLEVQYKVRNECFLEL